MTRSGDQWPVEDFRKAALPALTTVSSVFGLLILYVAVTMLVRGDATDQDYLRSVGFRIWAVSVAVTALAGLTIARRGVKELGSLSIRPEMLMFLILLFVLFAGLGCGLLALVTDDVRPDIPIESWPVRSSLLVLGAIVVAAPWVIVMWVCDARIRATPDATLEQLLGVWGPVERSLLALVVLLSLSTVSVGALRASVVAVNPSTGTPFLAASNSYPSANVLYVGGFFTILLAAAIIPVLLAWRRAARRIVDALLLPADDEKRIRLERQLYLNHSFVHSPLTVLGVLAPLLTGLLSQFLPELAS